jgi:cytochrome P450
MDVVKDLAKPLPFGIIMTMMGVPPSDREAVHQRMEAYAELRRPDPDRFGRILPAVSWLEEYLGTLIDERLEDPADDLLSKFAEGERVGALTREQSVGNAILILHAGQATTVSLISSGVLAFIRHPDQWDRLKSAPRDRAQMAVEEVLRYEPPVKIFDRIVGRDTTLHGEDLRAGDRVLCVISSANRDPRRFSEPDRLEIDRSPNPHLAFGIGFHSCIGATLARVEAQEVFIALATRAPDLALAVEEEALEYIPSMTQRLLTSLPVRW